jgi:hypothetical protein
MNILRSWNHYFFSKSLSIFDWLGITTIVNLASHDTAWWLLLMIPWIPLSLIMTERFTIKD